MAKLIAGELEDHNIPFAHLHGGVPSTQRGALLDRFREEADCRVFLSTDAGGVGLNLQKISLVVNMDLPWNPAVLEQRIGRVYRLGQEKGVQVINLISEGTIEHQMVSKLLFKSSLAEAVLDTAEDSVFMSDKKIKDFIENITEIHTDATTVDEAATDEDLERQPTAAQTSEETNQDAWIGEDWWDTEEESKPSSGNNTRGVSPQNTEKPVAEKSNAANGQGSGNAQNLVSLGVSFLSRLSQTLSDEKAAQNLVNELVQKDKETGETYLKIPVENEAIIQNAVKLLGGLLSKLG